MREITVNGKTYQVHATTGRVAAANKQLETRISGGGGGGSSYGGTGYTAPVSISSQTVTHDQIFLVDGNGREHALKLQNWDVTCREGNELTAVWMIRKGKERGPYVAIRNETLGETQYDDKELAKMHRPLWPLAALVVPFVLDFSGLSIMLAIAGLVFRHMEGVRGRNTMKASGQLFLAA